MCRAADVMVCDSVDSVWWSALGASRSRVALYMQPRRASGAAREGFCDLPFQELASRRIANQWHGLYDGPWPMTRDRSSTLGGQ